MRQGNVPNAYVKGELAETIYMCARPQLLTRPGMAFRLLKPLYDLKQSGRCWNEVIVYQVESTFPLAKLCPSV